MDSKPEYNPEDYVTPPQVAKAWGVHRNTVLNLIRTGRLPALIRPSGHYLVHRKYLKLPATKPVR